MTTSWRNLDPLRTWRTRRRGFTLIELLTVIGVIAILMALLVPAVGMVRRNAAKSRIHSQLSQYATAYESFRAQFGFYPSMGAAGAQFDLRGHNDVFIETLSGFDAEGGAPSTAYARQVNPRRMRFYTFAESEFAPADAEFAGQIVDAFGNPHLHVVIDRDLNGTIDPGEFSALPADLRPTEPLRGGVFFFVSNPDDNPDWEWIRSWE